VGPVIPGNFLSTMNGPKVPVLTVFPAMSETFTGIVCAALVSVPTCTAVVTLKLAGVARPDPASLAMHGTLTSAACHAATGGVHWTIGEVLSTLMVREGSEVDACPLVVVTITSFVPASSKAWNNRVVIPSLAPGIVADPVAPLMEPLAAFAEPWSV